MKKNLFTVLILALLVVNIALTVVMMISVTTTNKKTANLVDTIATVMNLELTGAQGETAVEPVAFEDTEFYQVPSMTIPLALETVQNADGTTSTGKQVHMMCEVSLSIDKKHEDYKKLGGENLTSLEPRIKEAIENVISSHDQIYCSEHRAELKAEILQEIQKVVGGSNLVYDISITDVKFG